MDIVATVFLSVAGDPQRPGAWYDPGFVDTLRSSIHRHGHRLTVFWDDTQFVTWDPYPLEQFIAVPSGGNPYWYRWQLYADWLRTVDCDRVWLVDATDVEMLHDPFPHMEPGALYVGSEPTVIGGPESNRASAWLYWNHPSTVDWFTAHQDWLILNAGIVGGDRATVVPIVEAMAAAVCDDLTDMGAFNRIVRDVPHVTGPIVHTVFRRNETDSPAWWRHK
jgi:hypothetical protein